MKAKDIVAILAGSEEYRELVKYQELAAAGVDQLSPEIQEHISELLLAVDEKVVIAGKQFLEIVTCSCRTNGNPESIYAKAVKHVQEAANAFCKQVDGQMPVYSKLIVRKRTNQKTAEKVAIAV